VVAGEIYCISEPAAGLRRGWLFAAGNALVVGIWLAIGLAMGLVMLVLFFPAVADITRAGGAEAMPLIVLVLLTLSPCLVPPLLVSLGGQGGRTLLDRFNRWLKPKQWALGLMVFFGMAAYLLISGIQAL
jgi:hypothetical protein